MNNTSQPTDGAAYNPSTGTWRHLRGSPLGNLTDSGSYVAWTGSRLVAWGFFGSRGSGSHGDGILAVGVYDPATNRWSQSATAPEQAPLFGDGDAQGRPLLLTPATGQWRFGPPSPTTATQTTPLWTGRDILLWGGGLPLSPISCCQAVATGAALQP